MTDRAGLPDPFHPTAAGAFLDTPAAAATVSVLVTALRAGAPVAVITGEPGTGKTTLLRRLLADLEEIGWRTAVEPLPLALGDLRDRLPQAAPGGRAAVGLDEAQAWEPGALAALDGIVRDRPDLSLVLVGEPDLEVRLARAAGGRALGSPVRCRVGALAPSEVASYLDWRWQQSRPASHPFDADAVARIASVSGGVPQMVNLVAGLTLRLAESRGVVAISAGLVDEAARDVLGRDARRPVTRRARATSTRAHLLRAAMVAAAVIPPLLAAGVVWRSATAPSPGREVPGPMTAATVSAGEAGRDRRQPGDAARGGAPSAAPTDRSSAVAMMAVEPPRRAEPSPASATAGSAASAVRAGQPGAGAAVGAAEPPSAGGDGSARQPAEGTRAPSRTMSDALRGGGRQPAAQAGSVARQPGAPATVQAGDLPRQPDATAVAQAGDAGRRAGTTAASQGGEASRQPSAPHAAGGGDATRPPGGAAAPPAPTDPVRVAALAPPAPYSSSDAGPARASASPGTPALGSGAAPGAAPAPGVAAGSSPQQSSSTTPPASPGSRTPSPSRGSASVASSPTPSGREGSPASSAGNTPAAPAPRASAGALASAPSEGKPPASPAVATAPPALPPRAASPPALSSALVPRDPVKDEALLRGAEYGDARAVQALLAEGASAEARDAAGFTPLMLAAVHGQPAAVEALLAGGARVNAQNRAGLTPLMFAAINDHASVLRMLVERGADVNARSRAGWTALTYAAWGGHPDIVRFLIARGADPSARDRDGWTVLQYASWRAAEPASADDLPPGMAPISPPGVANAAARAAVLSLLREAGARR